MLGHNRSLVWGDDKCAVATQDVCCGKARPLWWQDTREPQRGGRPKAASLVSCHHGGLALPQPDILCCHSVHLVSPHERSVVSQHPSPILQHPSRILQHPSASISMHHASSITQHASSIIHRWGVKQFMIFHFFENVRGALEMTARLGKGLREGSWAEPGHRRAEYAHFS